MHPHLLLLLLFFRFSPQSWERARKREDDVHLQLNTHTTKTTDQTASPMDTTLHPPPTRVHNSLARCRETTNGDSTRAREECQKRKKRTWTFTFSHFRFLEGVTREIPKTDQRFSFRDNRDEMFTTVGAEGYGRRDRDGSTWSTDEDGKEKQTGTNPPLAWAKPRRAQTERVKTNSRRNTIFIYRCIIRQMCSRYTQPKVNGIFVSCLLSPALDLPLSIGVCVCVCSRLQRHSKFQK